MATTIKGLDRLQRKLAALPVVAKDEMRKAMAQSADEMVAMAKALVPVSPVDGGTLRDSIGWTWDAPPTGSMVLGTVRARKTTRAQKRKAATDAAFAEVRRDAGLLATIYAGSSDAFYARWVEFGTAKATKQPFFFVSYRAVRKRAKNRIRRSQRTAAKKVAAS